MHAAALWYTKKFDFPRRNSQPLVQLMIATVPRSGSTAFCLDLWRTGLLGAPLEYTNAKMTSQEGRWRQLVGHELKYWKALKRVRTGPNGVFSYKFFVQEYVDILSFRPKLIRCISPTHVVCFTREDKLSQAVSYAKAIRSGVWFADSKGGKRCEYDEAFIQECMTSISRQEQSWEYVFDITNTSPLRATYEEFMETPDSVIQRIVKYAVPGSRTPRPVSIPNLEIQRDTVSDNWKERYLAGAPGRLAAALGHAKDRCW